ncbi:MAG: hypothetical protein QN163_04325 [Armatimonadota bacterium]|nr:hypothetical protein [Armatimonadota bacterium]MDR5698120.1 hypothetical protein [Armatimonadota bacterium]
MRRALVLVVTMVVVAAGAAVAGPAAGRVVLLCSPNPAWCDAVKAEFPKATGFLWTTCA